MAEAVVYSAAARKPRAILRRRSHLFRPASVARRAPPGRRGGSCERGNKKPRWGRLRSMRCNWRRWLWGLIPILLLGWLAVWAERDRVEADLGERAKVALGQAGMEWAATRFEGR